MMKKIALLLAALLCLCIFAASAEDEAVIWEICKAENGTVMDFDNDGIPEMVRVLFLLDEYEDGDFVLSVGNSIVTVRDCIGLEQEIYVMKAGYGWYCYGTVFMINEYGPSDDPLTYCFLYTEGELVELGCIPAMVSTFTVSNDGMITTKIRAGMVGTWYVPSIFAF